MSLARNFTSTPILFYKNEVAIPLRCPSLMSITSVAKRKNKAATFTLQFFGTVVRNMSLRAFNLFKGLSILHTL